MASSKLNKLIYTQVTKLKLLDKGDANPRFRVQKTPFDSDDEDESTKRKSTEWIIVGIIFPNGEIFNQRAYTIEIKLTAEYPTKRPEIRFNLLMSV